MLWLRLPWLVLLLGAACNGRSAPGGSGQQPEGGEEPAVLVPVHVPVTVAPSSPACEIPGATPNATHFGDVQDVPIGFRAFDSTICDAPPAEYVQHSYAEFSGVSGVVSVWNGTDFGLRSAGVYVRVATDGVTELARSDWPAHQTAIHEAVGADRYLKTEALAYRGGTVAGFRLRDLNGVEIGEPIMAVSNPATPTRPGAVAFHDGAFSVFWGGDPNEYYNYRLLGARYSPQGVQLTEPVVASPYRTFGPAIWTGQMYGFFWKQGHYMTFSRACPDMRSYDSELGLAFKFPVGEAPMEGTASLPEGDFVGAAYDSFDVLWDGQHFAASWREIHTVKPPNEAQTLIYYVAFGLFDVNGKPIGVPWRTKVMGMTGPKLAFDGNMFVVGWHGAEEGDTRDSYFMQRYDLQGDPAGCRLRLQPPTDRDYGGGIWRMITGNGGVWHTGREWVVTYTTRPDDRMLEAWGSLIRFDLALPPAVVTPAPQ